MSVRDICIANYKDIMEISDKIRIVKCESVFYH